MKKRFNRIATVIRSISWPTPKSIVRDTTITVLTTSILSLLIVLWTGGIEYIIDWIMSLF